MKVSLVQTEKLLTGNYAFTQLGFTMMLTRLKLVYKKEPSQGTIEKCMAEINLFLDKFGLIMRPDIPTIEKI
jgi:hypothetical protein